MIRNQHKKFQLFSIGVPLLALGVFVSWLIFKNHFDKSLNRSTDQQRVMSNPHGNQSEINQNQETAQANRYRSSSLGRSEAIAKSEMDPQQTRFAVRTSLQTPQSTKSEYELRSETRQLSTAFSDLYRQHEVAAQTSLHFPLFDGNFLELKALRHQPMGRDQGVIFAKVDSEPEGGHILLSYVGTALAGMIHLPLRGEFYEIRTAPDGHSHILSQLDPEKMPSCGTCMQHRTK